MNNIKLLSLAFIFAFSSSSLLSYTFGYPLIFHPINYGLSGFIEFGILILFLCLGLVFVSIPVSTRTILRLNLSNNYISIALINLLHLQLVIIFLGFFESYFTRGVTADLFYYYKCVTNSCIYVLTGNVTTIITTYLYFRIKSNNNN